VLGEQIGEERGRVTSQKIVDLEDIVGGPKVETTFFSDAKFNGIKTINTVTYWTVLRPNGKLYSEAKGVAIANNDNKEIVTYTSYGFGKITNSFGTNLRGSISYSAKSPAGTLSFLNNLVGIYEHESDQHGNMRSSIWKWLE
jgi:hypothetical protein